MKPAGYQFEGVDVSHHQPPARINYAAIPDFLVARASYGSRPDAQFLEHIKRTRDAGKLVGAYHFFRQTQPVGAQLDCFLEQMGRAGIGEGDLIPTLDLEYNVYDGKIDDTLWHNQAREIAGTLAAMYGTCYVYGSSYEILMHAGEWPLQHPLWVAHYRGASNFRGPSVQAPWDWEIWQYEGRNNEYLPDVYPGGPALDVNVASNLRLITPAVERLALALEPYTKDHNDGSS